VPPTISTPITIVSAFKACMPNPAPLAPLPSPGPAIRATAPA
jgi:hypothetical protein